MAVDQNYLNSIRAKDKTDEKGKSRLLSPVPALKKFLTEMLQAFADRKISFADLTRLDRKQIQKVSEAGYIKLRHGRYEEAKKIFELLTFLDHKNYFHHLALAGAYQKLKKYLDAVYQYSETIKLDSQNANAYVNRGEIFLRHKNFRKAAEDFREAILLDKIGKDPFANRARSLVIAIKRSLEREKQVKGRAPVAELPKRKGLSPLQMVKPRKR